MPKTWLVTGSASGIGRAICTAALERGDNVVATARDPGKLADLVGDNPDRVRTAALDVTDAAAAEDAVRTAVDVFGTLDVVVNNAGYAATKPIETTSLEEFRRQIDVNLLGVIIVSKAALPVFRAQESGHYLQFSSIGGRVGGTPGIAPYQSAKFGVEGFSLVLRSELAPFGIRVTIVEPGSFRTGWSAMPMDDGGPDYAETVGRMVRYRRESEGSARGDPAKAAQALLDVVEVDDPPQRLLLGPDALRIAKEHNQALVEETEAWAEVSRSTDF